LPVSSGCHAEIVLQLPLVSVILEVDAGIDRQIAHPREGRDSSAPFGRIVADKVIHLARQRLERLADRASVCADQRHAQIGRTRTRFALP
jgi:hypothetical protein